MTGGILCSGHREGEGKGSAVHDSGSIIIDRLIDFERSEDRIIVLSIALLVPSFALIAAVAAFSEEGPHSPLRLMITGVICLTTIPVGIAMTRLTPGHSWWRTSSAHRRPGTWFVLYADLGVAGVLFTFVDHETALYGTALLAVVGSYASHFLGAWAIAVHVSFANMVIIVLGVLTWRQGHHDVASVIARCLTSMIVASAAVVLVYVFTTGLRRIVGRQFDRAARDPLTGLWNRGGFTTLVKDILVDNRTVSFIVVDVDRFKRVNDKFGHAVGDAVLRLLGGRLQRLAGPATFVARTGGEEFTIALPQHKIDSTALAERICLAVHDVSDDVPVTVSVGVCRFELDEHQPPTLDPGQALACALETADAAMYEAKTAGGNRVVTKVVVAAEPEVGSALGRHDADDRGPD